jgi:hypothetical protein
MSESRRLARSLVEPEAITLESRYGRAESIERLRHAAGAFRTELEGERVTIVADHARLEARWEGGAQDLRLEGQFVPGRTTRFALYGMSLVMTLLMAASAWLLLATEVGTARFLVPLFTVLAVLALPFVFTGMASVAEADRSRIRKALRVALQDEEARYRKWEQED